LTEERGDSPDAGRTEFKAADLVTVRARASESGDGALDEQARGLLEANGLTTDPKGLLAALGSGVWILQGAAARLLGAAGDPDAVGELAHLLADPAGLEGPQVEAAYALARLGDSRGVEVLQKALLMPFEASPAPIEAAGALARLGDPSGLAVVASAVSSPNPVTSIVAVKQLPAFVGRLHPPGAEKLWQTYRTALSSASPAVAAEARSQLATLDHPEAAALLGQAEGGTGSQSDASGAQ
jgi:hypothetical protein